MLKNLASYIKIIASNRNILLDEINSRIYYKSKGQPQYSAIMIRHALLLSLLVKNIRNNLLHCKKFVFPLFTYNIKDGSNSCPAGYITWGDFHHLYSKDEQLQGNLRKAPKSHIKVFTLETESKMFLLHCPFSMKQQLHILKVIFKNERNFWFSYYFSKMVDCFKF